MSFKKYFNIFREKTVFDSLFSEEYGLYQNVNKGYIPQAAGGKIKFLSEGMETGLATSKYIYIVDESWEQFERLTSDMMGKWDFMTPKLVLTILSSAKHFKTWGYNEDIDNFQDGLMKAAGLAEMIILVDGQNHGVTQIIGEAVAKEKNRRKILAREQTLTRFIASEQLPRITVIGLLPQEALSQAVSNTVSESVNAGTLGKTNLLISPGNESIDLDVDNLNSNLPYFLIMNKDMGPAGHVNFARRLELRLSRPFVVDRRSAFRQQTETDEDVGSVPLIGLLVQGGPQEIDRVLTLVKKNVPVIVLWGLGMAGDIIAYAAMESQKSYDSYTYELYVKAELRNLIANIFPEEFQGNSLARNQCRDRVLQCVSYATQGEASLLTLVNAHTHSQDLSKAILTSVLNSYNMRATETDQIEYALQLCLDWESPEMALTNIYSKYSRNLITVTDDMFQQALLRPNREDFVDLFLDRGFVLHGFLSATRLATLFERCQDKEVFAGVCLETILGEKVIQSHIIQETFVGGKNCDLNRLLRYLTKLRHLVNPEELTTNAGPDRAMSAVLAEKKALYALLYWAALTNNIKLVKILWKRTSEPMAAALVLSTLYSRMAKNWVDDHDLRLSIEKHGIEFGQCAVKMLDLAYVESKTQAMLSLTKPLPDFNNRRATELAQMGKNKFFIAHPCCQQLILSQWYGSVRFIRYYNVGLFAVPEIVKMLLSMILIFPTYFWIDTVKEFKYTEEKEKESSTQPSEYRIIERAKKRRHKEKDNEKNATIGNVRSVFLIQKLYYMWTAPVTKYWLATVFYLMFLGVYAMSVMMPFCGNPFLNQAVSIWLAILLVDQIIQTLTRRRLDSDSRVPQMSSTLVMLCTLIIIVVFRILRPKVLPFTSVKIALSFSLIFFFYKGMNMIFPASQTLGPLFLNIKTMMKKDLLRWLRIWFLTLISGAISIHAVLYPAYPLDYSAISKAFLRGILGLFITDVSDLAGDSCSCLYHNFSSCDVKSIPRVFQEKIETCPHSSAGGYFVVLLYFFDTKLVYYVLIFAICNVTLSNVYSRSVEIWKFQFFLLVQEYSNRMFLPVPLAAILYPFKLMYIICHVSNQLVRKHCPCCKSQDKQPPKSEEYHMWKVHVKAFGKQEKLEQDKKNLVKSTEQRLSDLQLQQITFRRVISNFNNRLVELLDAQRTESLMMEHLSETVESLRLNKTSSDLPQALHHRQCRMSPYPSTNIRRFAVFDKNVTWEEPYPSYDPPIYSKPVLEFDESIRQFIDPDVFDLTRVLDDQDHMNLSVEEFDPLSEFKPEYNSVTEATTRSGETFTLDRTSWITKDNQQITYNVDLTGVPRNPMGRTGLRGRGNLWRWGPNHAMYAIVSRWRKNVPSSGGSKTKEGPLLVKGKKVLEILVAYNETLKEDSLPGAFVSGRTSKYSVMCEMFMRDLMGETDIPGSAQLDEDDMIQFFRQFQSELRITNLLNRALSGVSNFSSQLVYRGYMDDRRNTDNAWMEAEIWNFHYDRVETFDQKISESERRWREVSVLMQLDSSKLHYVLEVAKMHSAT